LRVGYQRFKGKLNKAFKPVDKKGNSLYAPGLLVDAKKEKKPLKRR